MLHSLDQEPPNIGENLTELFHHINELVNVDAIIFINVEFDPKIVFYAFDFIFRMPLIRPMSGHAKFRRVNQFPMLYCE